MGRIEKRRTLTAEDIRALSRAYDILLRATNKKAVARETLEGQPGPTASTSDQHRCTNNSTLSGTAEQIGGEDE